MDQNQIIQQIHSEFSGAEQQIIDQAKDLIDNYSPSHQAMYEHLRQMGFERSKSVHELNPQRVKHFKWLKDLIGRYQEMTPQYKFITQAKLDEILDKYGLLLGPANAFKAEIPEYHQQVIVDFKIVDERYLESYNPLSTIIINLGKYGLKTIPELSDKEIVNLAKALDGTLRFQRSLYYVTAHCALLIELMKRGYDVRDITFLDSNNHSSYIALTSLREVGLDDQMYVAATDDCFDKSACSIVDVPGMRNKVLSAGLANEIYREQHRLEREARLRDDPIVLRKVVGGWLIVTAWGPEAQDNKVHNPNLN